MSKKNEALRLADRLENGGAIDAYACRSSTAAELRRLHQFAEDQIGRATAAEAALQMTKATHALKFDRLVAQRDALLEALKSTRAFINSVAPHGSLLERVNAAIKAVEGEKT